jgi:hypothetical protein
MVAALALGGVALTAVTVGVTLAGVDATHSELAATGRALMVLVPVAVGCYAWYRGPHRRFGLLLMAAGFGWFLTTLAESDNSLLYSTGRVAGWLVELELVYLALSFPSGRITESVDRWIVLAAVVLVAVLYLPTALIASDYPVPVPYTSCESGCPGNAFFVLDSEPGFVDSVMRPLRDALAAFLFLAVVFRLAQRVTHSTQPMRMALTPVLVVAGLRFLAAGLFVLMRRVGASSEAVEGVAWVAALALPNGAGSSAICTTAPSSGSSPSASSSSWPMRRSRPILRRDVPASEPSARRSTRHWRRSGPSPTASTRRCSLTRASARRCVRPPGMRLSSPRFTWMESAAIRPRSRAPSTFAASRPFRTRPSTRMARRG